MLDSIYQSITHFVQASPFEAYALIIVVFVIAPICGIISQGQIDRGAR